MNWQDKGYLLSLNKYNENSSIAEFFTETNGKVVGVKLKNSTYIYAIGSSKKIAEQSAASEFLKKIYQK